MENNYDKQMQGSNMCSNKVNRSRWELICSRDSSGHSNQAGHRYVLQKLKFGLSLKFFYQLAVPGMVTYPARGAFADALSRGH
jgi:hypothetical protein